MTQFYYKLLRFLLPIFFISAVLFFFPPSGKDNGYLASITDKNKLLISHKASIILIGGSNLAFGVDSRYLNSALDFPVINYGVQGGLGVFFQLEYVKDKVVKGDKIVLVPEYDQFIDENILGEGKVLAKIVMLEGANVMSIMNFKQIKLALPFLLSFSIEKIAFYFKTSNRGERHSFNEFGDFVGHLNLANRKAKSLERYYTSGKLSEETIKIINDYRLFFNKKGVSLVVSFPPYPQKLYAHDISRIDSINNLIKSNSIPTLGTPKDFAYEESYFFEYPLHLNKAGRQKRSEKFIQLFRDLNINDSISYKLK